jgi:S-adenosylmethionine hydrolase
LTTDFGTADWFVGTMKGVIATLAPRAMVVDITHEIPAGDVLAGAFALAASCPFFPKGTIHVAVIDPGVGSTRKAIAVETGGQFFVGPDNGVLSFALRRQKVGTIRWLQNEDYFLTPVSRTFHGRNIFAPVAAHLSRGVRLSRLGPAVKGLIRLPWPEPARDRGKLQGEIICLDRFGNAITNLELKSGAQGEGRFVRCEVHGAGRWIIPLHSHYQAVEPGRAVALIGSLGLLELAINAGSAEKKLGLKRGMRVDLLGL